MLNFSRVEKLLNIPLPEELRQRISADTTVSIVSAESIFGTIPTCSTYEWNGGLSSKRSGCVFAAALGHGRWTALDIAEDWSNARGEQYESTVPPIGEQLESLGVLRPAIIILLEEDYDSDDDADEEKKLIIGIGGKSIRRYLAWRVKTAAAELTNALRDVPEPPKEPRRRSRQALLAD